MSLERRTAHGKGTRHTAEIVFSFDSPPLPIHIDEASLLTLADARTAQFARYIEVRLNGKPVNPLQFNIEAILAVYDLRKRNSSVPIPRRLRVSKPETYDRLINSIPGVARVAFPPEFADDVERVFRQLHGNSASAPRRRISLPASSHRRGKITPPLRKWNTS